MLEEAQAASEKGDYRAASARYEEFLKADPRHEQVAAARLRLAIIYHLNLHDYDRAVRHYIHLIEDYPGSAEVAPARFRLADCYARMFQCDQAVSTLEGAEPDPRVPDYITRRIAALREEQRQRTQ